MFGATHQQVRGRSAACRAPVSDRAPAWRAGPVKSTSPAAAVCAARGCLLMWYSRCPASERNAREMSRIAFPSLERKRIAVEDVSQLDIAVSLSPIIHFIDFYCRWLPRGPLTEVCPFSRNSLSSPSRVSHGYWSFRGCGLDSGYRR